MNFDRFGLNKEFCEERGYKIFFGTDWLDDPEYEALEKFSRGSILFLFVADSKTGPISVDSFDSAVKLESDFVDVDKIIKIHDYAVVYVSDDRDIFLVAAAEDKLSKLVDDVVSAGGKTYSSLVKSGTALPKKQVKEFFDYWAPLNFELS
ncbi:hypothetical protein HRR99_22105 [Agrobacterium vaccinii]|uniref:hypothetical protein n=1 Tax=Agrobacterium vaccinii TaxID=2735528 RepID=UPI001E3A30E5|nr:hypothetical protein [Agrobacterium vaccinii]UHS64204.1 hypothetical protein HRR99_22105 [Agrobacterium vaccinii]